MQPLNQSINQSIDEYGNQSINHLINEQLDREEINQSIKPYHSWNSSNEWKNGPISKEITKQRLKRHLRILLGFFRLFSLHAASIGLTARFKLNISALSRFLLRLEFAVTIRTWNEKKNVTRRPPGTTLWTVVKDENHVQAQQRRLIRVEAKTIELRREKKWP